MKDQDASPDIAGDKYVCATIIVKNEKLLLESMAQGQRKMFELSIWIEDPAMRRRLETVALLDTGASGIFVDRKFAKANRLTLEDLPEPIIV